MRKRLKSMYLEAFQPPKQSDLENNDHRNTESSKWTEEQFLKLLEEVQKQLPEEDTISYDERLKMIDWHKIKIENFSRKEIKRRMNEYILEARTFRLLAEVMHDCKGLVREKAKPKYTPFLFYYDQIRKNKEKVTYNDARKQFKGLDSSEKLSWLLKFLEVKDGEKLNYEQFKKATEILSFNEMILIDEYEERPKRMSAFNFFVKQYAHDNKISKSPVSGKEFFKSAVEAWKSQSEENIMEQKKKTANLKAQYEIDHKRFLDSLSGKRKAFELQIANDSRKRTNEKKPAVIKRKSASKKLNNEQNKNKSNLKRSLTVGNEDTSHEEDNNEKIPSKKKEKKIKYHNDIEQEVYNENENSQNESKNKSVVNEDTFHEEDNNEIMPSKKMKKKSKYDNDIEQEIYSQSENSQNESKNKSNLKRSLTVANDDTFHEEETMPSKKKKAKKSKYDNDIKEAELENFSTNTVTNNNALHDEGNDETVQFKKKNSKKPKYDNEFQNVAVETYYHQSSEEENKNKFNLKKPPDSMYKYYVLKVFDGPKTEAKHSFKTLSEDEKEKLRKKHKKAKKKFLRKFELYLKTLSKDDIANFNENIEENEDFSDITDSEGELE